MVFEMHTFYNAMNGNYDVILLVSHRIQQFNYSKFETKEHEQIAGLRVIRANILAPTIRRRLLQKENLLVDAFCADLNSQSST